MDGKISKVCESRGKQMRNMMKLTTNGREWKKWVKESATPTPMP